MMRRLGVLVAVTALFVLAAAPVSASDQTFEFEINRTATLNQFNTELTISGTYTCNGPFEPDFSGLGGEVFQSQKGGKIVVGGNFGLEGGLICDDTEQFWEAVVTATFGNEHATWKRGRVIFNGGGGINLDGGEEHQANDGFLGSLKIVK